MIDNTTQINVQIKKCARCGQDHKDVKFYVFKINPIDDYNYFGFCKVTNEPILLKIIESRNNLNYGPIS